MPNGYIIYEGPSLYDGKPIVVIANGFAKPRNRKTGAMIQTYIIRPDISPIDASRLGEDKSICGECPHMGKANPDKPSGVADGRSCYVNLGQGVLQTWKAYRKGAYPKVTGHRSMRDLGLGRPIRLGTYGDPAAVPQYVWDSLLDSCDFWTGYTHGKVNPAPDRLMTSAESARDARKAWDRGERTFRVVRSVNDLVRGSEALCPASEEAGKRATCATCKLCAGSSVKAKSIAIVAHGPSHVKRNAMERVS